MFGMYIVPLTRGSMKKKTATRRKRTTSRQGPSLEQQLKDSRVIAGSALETLIKQNQDFSMLDPSEFHDGLPFPLWLRVFFRKCHPEINFSSGNPGYPLILKESHSYMIRHQDLPEVTPPAEASKLA
jgi:hypothetical protein